MAILLSGKKKELGGFTVKRILPHPEKKMIGPFIFFDHMGPAHFEAGEGINVRPHPHIGLATITYLFEGALLHHDSLGTIQEIRPGDVNWMTAGKGIVHSERETIETRASAHKLDGIQSWVALPKEKASIEPAFLHIPRFALPYIHREKLLMRIIAGDAFGYSSPVKTYSPMFYIDCIAEKGAEINRPNDDFETAVYVQMGAVSVGHRLFAAGDLILYEKGDQILTATENSRFLFIGGEPFDLEPIIDWNFVAYETQTIKAAKARWQKGDFPDIPGDNEERISLPTED